MANIIIVLLIMIPAGLEIHSLVRVFQGKERCECTGDCSKCKIQCQSSKKYYGIQTRSWR